MTAPAAGGIRVDLTIDGSKVSAETKQAVSRQLQPIIDQATKSVDGLEASLKKVGASGGLKDVARDAGKTSNALDEVIKSHAAAGRGVEKYADTAKAAYKKVADATAELKRQQDALEQQQKSGNATWIKVQAEQVKQAKQAEAKAVKEAAAAYGEYVRAARGGVGSMKLSDRFKATAGEAAGAGKDAANHFAQGFAGATAITRVLGTGGPVGAALAGLTLVGFGVGKRLADEIGKGLATLHVKDVFAAGLGIDEQTAARYGKQAAEAYARQWGESIGDNLGAVQSAIHGGLLNRDATDADIQDITAKLQSMKEVMGKDIPEVARAAGQLLRGGLAKDADEALDIIVGGFQRGNDIAGDWLDTITEYSTQFRKLGIDGPEAIGLIQQGLAGAARDSDVVADSIKEFSIRAVDGSKTTAEGFKALGFNADDMAARFAKGGDTAHDAFGQVLQALKNTDDPMQQKLIWADLFGTQWEDLGDAVNKFDLRAADALGHVQGASDAATDAVSRHASEWDNLERNVGNVFTKLREWLADSDIARFLNIIPQALNDIIDPASAAKRYGPPGPIPGALPGTPVTPGSLPGLLTGTPSSNVPGGLPGLLLPSTTPAPGQPAPPPGSTAPTGPRVPIVPDADQQKAQTDADKRKAIEAQFPLDQFLNQMPGATGQPPMQVNVTNMPPSGIGGSGLPGLPGIPSSGGLPGVPAAGPVSNDKLSIARYIVSAASQLGYNPDQITAILSTGLQESGLNPTASGGGGAWKGIFQQDSSYPNPTDPMTNINSFFERLQSHGGPSGDIWKNIFWLQQRPGDQSADSAYAQGRQAYLSEIQSQLGPASSLYQQVAGGGTPAPTIPGGFPPTGLPDPHGAHTQVSYLALIAQQLGLSLTAGKNDHVDDGLNHPKGLAGDFAIPGMNDPDPQKRAFAQFLAQNFGDLLNELIYSDPGFSSTISMGKPYQYDAGTLADHRNHVHASVSDANAPEFIRRVQALMGGGIPGGLGQNMYATNGPLQVDPLTGQQGYFQVDQQAVWEATNARDKANYEFAKASREYAIAVEEQKQNLATESDVLEARQKVIDAQNGVTKAEADLAEKSRGSFKNAQPMDYSKLPFGDPRRILAGAITGAGGTMEDVAGLLGPIFSSAAAPVGQIAGDIAGTVGGFPIGVQGTPTAPSTGLNQLAGERNPLFLAQAGGFNVPDYTRQGGGASAQNLMLNNGLPNDAQGRIYSDTAALIDRTFTNLDAAEKARHDQVMTVLNEVRDKLSKDALAPVVKEGVAGGMGAMGDSVTAALGSSLGAAAGPPIASAVANAIPSGGGGGGGAGAQLVNTGAGVVSNIGQAAMSVNSGGFHSYDFDRGNGFAPLPLGMGPLGNLYDEGGLWPHGTFGTNLSGAPERVLDPDQTRLFDAGLLGGWNLQPLQQHYATVSGVDASSTVGAEFFGVSQVPILGAIVNLLVAVLLKVIGVQVQARDTLDEIAADFRDFRGDFKAFDASGRLMNDTSGLMDRTSTNEQTAADERIRILKQVLEGLFKFIVEKVIVPIAKAVGNSLLQAAAGAASGAIGASFPGGSIVGGMVGNIIQSAGSAGIDIAAEIGTILSESIFSVATDAIGQLLQSYLPGVVSSIFGGGLLAAITDPITSVLNGLIGGITMVFGGLTGGLASLIPGLPFDDGGLAIGTGLMPKNTIRPERVLSPNQTVAFEELPGELRALVGALKTRGHDGGTIDVGGIHVHAQHQSPRLIAREVSDILMSKLT